MAGRVGRLKRSKKPTTLTIDWGAGAYMHLHSGGMLIGDSDPNEPPVFSQTRNLDHLALMWKNAVRRLPQVEKASMKAAHAGL